VFNYPRGDTPIPFYSIALLSENETRQFLGDSGGFVDPLELIGTAGDPQTASIWTHEFAIFCATEHADWTLYNYYMAKWLFERHRRDFLKKGVLNLTMSGSDFAPDPRYFPVVLYVRQLRVQLMREMHADAPTPDIRRAHKVRPPLQVSTTDVPARTNDVIITSKPRIP
jgi:hypothetical protein